MALLFSDVFKATKDFFSTKTFAYDHKVEIKSSADSGVDFTSEGGISEKKNGFASLKAEYKKGSVQADKLQIGTDGKILADFSMPEVAAGTKATFKLEDGTRTSNADISAKFGVETKQNWGVLTGITAEVDPVKATGAASVTFNHNGILLGGSGALDTHLNSKDGKGIEATAYDALVGYKSSNATYAFQTDGKFKKGTVFFNNPATQDVTVTGKAGFGLPYSDVKDITAAFGAKYALDGSTNVFGAIDQAANVQLAYETRVSPKASLTVFGLVRALDIGGDEHKLGTKFALRA